MTRLIDFLKDVGEFLAAMRPGFTTDWVGCVEQEDGISYPVYPMQIWDVREDGIPDAVCLVRSFRILGWSIFGKVIAEPLTYQEWKGRREHA